MARSYTEPPRQRGAEWGGLLLPPLAWLVQLQAQLALVPFVCAHGGAWALHAATALGLAGAAVGGALAWSVRHGSVEGSRPRFMGAVGLMVAVIFGLLAAAQGAATFVYHPCD